MDWNLVASFDLKTFAALVSLQLVMSLYGAGVRRPFGSLATIQDLPEPIRSLDWTVKIMDWLFVTFVVAMIIAAYYKVGFWYLIIFASVFTFVGEFLKHRIRLIPSFFISCVAAALCVILMFYPSKF